MHERDAHVETKELIIAPERPVCVHMECTATNTELYPFAVALAIL
jgi:hypothetical protein